MKNLLTHFSKIRGYFSASQGNDVGYDCRLTVVRPSFDCRSTVLKLCSILVIVLTVGVGNAWGDVITLTYADISATSYSSSEATFTDGVSFGYVQTIRNGNGTPSGWATSQVIQMRGNSGVLYNKGAISTISNIRIYVVTNTNAFTLHYGTSTACTDGNITRPTTATGTEDITYTAYAKGGKTTPGTSGTATYYDFNLSSNKPTYFKIVDGSGALYVWKIVITYSAAPACAEPNAPTNSSFF